MIMSIIAAATHAVPVLTHLPVQPPAPRPLPRLLRWISVLQRCRDPAKAACRSVDPTPAPFILWRCPGPSRSDRPPFLRVIHVYRINGTLCGDPPAVSTCFSVLETILHRAFSPFWQGGPLEGNLLPPAWPARAPPIPPRSRSNVLRPMPVQPSLVRPALPPLSRSHLRRRRRCARSHATSLRPPRLPPPPPAPPLHRRERLWHLLYLDLAEDAGGPGRGKLRRAEAGHQPAIEPVPRRA